MMMPVPETYQEVRFLRRYLQMIEQHMLLRMYARNVWLFKRY
jgi:hypothetical protein